MPYIETSNDIPGIRGLMSFRPEAAAHLNELVQVLLVEESPLSRGERELIASFVSSRNQCKFCMTSHGAIAAALLDDDKALIKSVQQDYENADISDKLKSLLHIAGKVQQNGKLVTDEDVTAARKVGANDREIHDAVLIAAVFSMFNRYVDGLGATTPNDPAFYDLIGKQRAAEGYLTKSVLMK